MNASFIQVIKGVHDKQMLDCHRSFTLDKKFCAFGVHHVPNQEMTKRLGIESQFLCIFRDDETQEMKAYHGDIYTVIKKDLQPKQYKEAYRRYGALYYDYEQYKTIYLIENLTLITKEDILTLVKDYVYAKDASRVFTLDEFTHTRTNQLYLKHLVC